MLPSGGVIWSYPTVQRNRSKYIMISIKRLPLDVPANAIQVVNECFTRFFTSWWKQGSADIQVIDAICLPDRQTGLYNGDMNVVLYGTATIPSLETMLYVQQYDVQCLSKAKYGFAYCKVCKMLNAHD